MYPYGPPPAPLVQARRRLSPEAILWWSLAVICVALFVVCVIVLLGVQPSFTMQVACGLGNQSMCDQIQSIATLRQYAFFGLIGTTLAGAVFVVLALFATLR